MLVGGRLGAEAVNNLPQPNSKQTSFIVGTFRPVRVQIALQTSSLSSEVKPKVWPSEPEARVQYALDTLRAYGYNESDMQVWERIVRNEAKNRGYALDARPDTFVQHCKGAQGWYAVEVVNGAQGKCKSGDEVGMREQSVGIFQILEQSSWKRLNCGDLGKADDHIACAVKIQRLSGFGQWTTAF